MSVYKDNSVINLLYLDKLRNLNAKEHMPMGSARRFRLPSPSPSKTTLTAAADAIVEFTSPQSQSIELPVVAPAVYNKPYRYAYGITKIDPEVQHTIADGIVKLDMSSPASSPTTNIWSKPNHTPSEPVFVPRPNGTEEDDGVLLSVVLDERATRSSLVVIDAKEMKEVARAEMGAVFPIGFHGVWYGGDV
jgi:torulene dioxygenase